MKLILTIATIATLTMLTGCAGIKIPEGTFANRVSRSLDCKQMYINSMYGPLGLTSKVDTADNAAVPCTTPAASVAAPAPAASATAR